MLIFLISFHGFYPSNGRIWLFHDLWLCDMLWVFLRDYPVRNGVNRFRFWKLFPAIYHIWSSQFSSVFKMSNINGTLTFLKIIYILFVSLIVLHFILSYIFFISKNLEGGCKNLKSLDDCQQLIGSFFFIWCVWQWDLSS